MRVYSFNSELNIVSGIQKVLISIHEAIKNNFEAKIVGTIPWNNINKDLHIRKTEYVKLKNPFVFRDSIVILHQRKFLIVFWLLNKIFNLHCSVVYVHHSLLYGNRLLTIMPQNIVAISDSGIENLNHYFNVPLSHIHKIYNCVVDVNPPKHKLPDRSNIYVLYPARIDHNKRQLEIIDKLLGRLDHRVKIFFAGDGPLYSELYDKIKQSDQFYALGFKSDMISLLLQADYVLLFSMFEGLSISLIEATMCGVPIICNSVGGNLEIAESQKNAFVVDEWDKLTSVLNSLPNISHQQYQRMSEESRKKYEANFTFEKFKSNYVELLSNI